jgi:hypothetical protein
MTNGTVPLHLCRPADSAELAGSGNRQPPAALGRNDFSGAASLVQPFEGLSPPRVSSRQLWPTSEQDERSLYQCCKATDILNIAIAKGTSSAGSSRADVVSSNLTPATI